MQILVLLLCQLLLIFFAGYLIYSWLTKTPFYPSSTKELDKLFETLDLPFEGRSFIDVGSGDGRFVIWASKKGMKSTGIEFNPFLTLFSRLVILLNRQSKNAVILNQNFKDHNYSDYNYVYLYIFPEHMDEISDKLFKELKPGSVIITNTFNFKNPAYKPDREFERFYIYEIK